MNDIFIKEIQINKVRHLKDMKIHVSDTERKHLIITGKNGSGKTSLLNEIRNNLIAFQNNQLFGIPIWKAHIQNYRQSIFEFEKLIQNADNEKDRLSFHNEIINYTNEINNYEQKIANLSNIELELNGLDFIKNEYSRGNLTLAFFEANRPTQMQMPNGIKKLEVKSVYPIEEKANRIFIQYLVNLKAQRSFARDANNMKIVEDIDNWFYTFEHYLKEIFEDETLTLEFDSENFDFNIVQKNKEPFNLNTLSDGYSAILNIITELIVRMEKRSSRTYELQGIVLIDEIETHLHVELQKLVLPFLTKIFPKIQFIVTTHSPFVLNSISNAVIFDLEKNVRAEDFSAYAYDGIIETYFDNEKYSEITKTKLERYKHLLFKEDIQEVETNELRKIEYYFENIPAFVAPELINTFQNLRIQKVNQNG